jgi:hypothetical protein
VHDQADAALHVQLLVQMGHVRVDGFEAQVEFPGDLLVRQFSENEAQHFHLTDGQAVLVGEVDPFRGAEQSVVVLDPQPGVPARDRRGWWVAQHGVTPYLVI